MAGFHAQSGDKAMIGRCTASLAAIAFCAAFAAPASAMPLSPADLVRVAPGPITEIRAATLSVRWSIAPSAPSGADAGRPTAMPVTPDATGHESFIAANAAREARAIAGTELGVPSAARLVAPRVRLLGRILGVPSVAAATNPERRPNRLPSFGTGIRAGPLPPARGHRLAARHRDDQEHSTWRSLSTA
jgi:hypothetical protein